MSLLQLAENNNVIPISPIVPTSERLVLLEDDFVDVVPPLGGGRTGITNVDNGGNGNGNGTTGETTGGGSENEANPFGFLEGIDEKYLILGGFAVLGVLILISNK